MAEELKQFWGSTCSQTAYRKKDAVNVQKQEKIDLNTRSLRKVLGRMPYWK